MRISDCSSDVCSSDLAGLYRLANQLANSLTKISGLLSRSIFVELSRTHSSHGHEALGTLFRRTNRLALVAGAAIIALILAVGHPLLGLIAGKDRKSTRLNSSH